MADGELRGWTGRFRWMWIGPEDDVVSLAHIRVGVIARWGCRQTNKKIFKKKFSKKNSNFFLFAMTSLAPSSMSRRLGASSATSLSPPSFTGELPPDWRRAIDAATGRDYFYHRVTRETSWVLPSSPAPPSSFSSSSSRTRAATRQQQPQQRKLVPPSRSPPSLPGRDENTAQSSVDSVTGFSKKALWPAVGGTALANANNNANAENNATAGLVKVATTKPVDVGQVQRDLTLLKRRMSQTQISTRAASLETKVTPSTTPRGSVVVGGGANKPGGTEPKASIPAVASSTTTSSLSSSSSTPSFADKEDVKPRLNSNNAVSQPRAVSKRPMPATPATCTRKSGWFWLQRRCIYKITSGNF